MKKRGDQRRDKQDDTDVGQVLREAFASMEFFILQEVDEP